MKALCSGLVLAVLALAPAAPPAGADTVLAVDTLEDTEAGNHARCAGGGECSLREALERVAAGEEAGVDGAVTIAIEAEGEINISAHGELKIEAGGGVESVAIEGPGRPIQGSGAAGLTIGAHGAGRVLYVGEVDAKISGLAIAGGHVGAGGGGGLFSDSGSVVLENVQVTESTVSGEGEGGGINIEKTADLEMIDSRVDHNHSETGGGGIWLGNGSPVTIRESEIDNNTATAGAGLGAEPSSEEARLTIVESSVSWNEASAIGGGLDLRVSGALERSTVNGNTAGGDFGGGVNLVGAAGLVQPQFVITTSTIARNAGGGIAAAGELAPLIESSTIVENTTATTPGAGLEGSGLEGFGIDGFQVRSSILAADKRGEEEAECHGTVASGGGNIVDAPAEAPGCAWEAGEGDAFETDPELAPLNQNGGPTFTMMPTTRHSPVINHGLAGRSEDQRGLARPVPAGLYDVGAVEVQAPVNEVAPTIDAPNEPAVGDTLECIQGDWDTDTIDPSVEFAWVVGEEVIERSQTHELTNADAGRQLECEASVDNGATATTARTAPFELPPPTVQLSPSPLDLGSRRAGSGPGNEEAVTVTNTSGAGVALEINTIISTDPTQFPITASACEGSTIAPGDSCEVEVGFAPTAAGAQSAELVVESNAAAVSDELSGVGLEAKFASTPPEHDFGEQRIGGGASAAQSFAILDAGDASMEIGEITIAGSGAAQFQLTGDQCSHTTLEPSGECTVSAVFVPTAAGPQRARVEVPGQAPGSIPLSGTGTEAKISLDPGEHNFGARQLGAGPSAPQSFTVTSTGTAPVRLGQATIEGPGAGSFAIAVAGDSCSGGLLAPGGSCTLAIAFTPRGAGALSASLRIPGEGAEATATLSGTGTEAPPPPSTPQSPEPPAGAAQTSTSQGPEPPTGAAPPTAVLVPDKGGYVVADRKRIRFKLRCKSSQVACQTRLWLVREGHVVGRGRGRLGPGTERTVEVLLSRRGRAEITGRAVLRATLRIATAGRRTDTAKVTYRGRRSR